MILLLSAVFVKVRIAGVEITAVELILRYAESFAETLVVDDFALSQEADRIAYIRVVGKAEDIVVGGACLLFGSHVLVKIGDDIAL